MSTYTKHQIKQEILKHTIRPIKLQVHNYKLLISNTIIVLIPTFQLSRFFHYSHLFFQAHFYHLFIKNLNNFLVCQIFCVRFKQKFNFEVVHEFLEFLVVDKFGIDKIL